MEPQFFQITHLFQIFRIFIFYRTLIHVKIKNSNL